jgi:hypothetical protein
VWHRFGAAGFGLAAFFARPRGPRPKLCMGYSMLAVFLSAVFLASGILSLGYSYLGYSLIE